MHQHLDQIKNTLNPPIRAGDLNRQSWQTCSGWLLIAVAGKSFKSILELEAPDSRYAMDSLSITPELIYAASVSPNKKANLLFPSVDTSLRSTYVPISATPIAVLTYLSSISAMPDLIIVRDMGIVESAAILTPLIQVFTEHPTVKFLCVCSRNGEKPQHVRGFMATLQNSTHTLRSDFYDGYLLSK